MTKLEWVNLTILCSLILFSVTVTVIRLETSFCWQSASPERGKKMTILNGQIDGQTDRQDLYRLLWLKMYIRS